MEDGDFKSASEYTDRVLDIDPECAEAYTAKVCITFSLNKESDLATLPFQYHDNADWQKALRFANPQQKTVYEGYTAKVKQRTERQIRDYAYDCAMEMAVNPNAKREQLDAELSTYKNTCLYSEGIRADGTRRANSARNEEAFQRAVRAGDPGDISQNSLSSAANMFKALNDVESSERAKQCLTLANQARQKKIYNSAVELYREGKDSYKPETLEKALKQFLSIPDYKDAKEYAQRCKDSQFLVNEAIAKAKKAAARRKRFAIIAGIILAISAITAYVVTQVVIPSNNYKKAEELRANGDFNEAISVFRELGSYNDAATQIDATYYAKGMALLEASDWSGARSAFTNAGDYSDAKKQINAAYYAEGEAKRADGDYAGAVTAFQSAGNYSDAKDQILITYYAEGEAKRLYGDWDGAIIAFESAKDYSDAETQIFATHYAEGIAKRNAQDWAGAIVAFGKAGDYSDAEEQILATYYAEGEGKRASGDWDDAISAFENVKDYKDAKAQISATYYEEGKEKYKAGDMNGAIDAFTNAGDYKDAKTQVLATQYAAGILKFNVKDWDGAILAFEKANGFNDSKDQIVEAKFQKAISLYNQGDMISAYALFSEIKNYKDVNSRIEIVISEMETVREQKLELFKTVKNYVFFGNYPQSRDTSIATPIEWLVLYYDEKENKALLISRYILDSRFYDNDNKNDWEKCSLRTWLNKEFLVRAFSVAEQNAILESIVDNSENQQVGGGKWTRSGGNNTVDKVFILSNKEATSFFKTDNARKCELTSYASRYIENTWWLRSSDNLIGWGLCINEEGRIDDTGVGLNQKSRGIRPAIWISLNADCFDWNWALDNP